MRHLILVLGASFATQAFAIAALPVAQQYTSQEVFNVQCSGGDPKLPVLYCAQTLDSVASSDFGVSAPTEGSRAGSGAYTTGTSTNAAAIATAAQQCEGYRAGAENPSCITIYGCYRNGQKASDREIQQACQAGIKQMIDIAKSGQAYQSQNTGYGSETFGTQSREGATRAPTAQGYRPEPTAPPAYSNPPPSFSQPPPRQPEPIRPAAPVQQYDPNFYKSNCAAPRC